MGMRGILKLTDGQGDPTWFHQQWASKNYKIQHVADLIHWLDEQPDTRPMDTAGYLAYAAERGEGFLPTEDVSDVPDCRDASNPIDLDHRYHLTLSQKDRSFRFAVVDIDREKNMTVAHDLASRFALYDAAARMAQDLAKNTRAYAVHNGGVTPPSMPTPEQWDAEAERYMEWKAAAEEQPQAAGTVSVGDLVISWGYDMVMKWGGLGDGDPRSEQIHFSYGGGVSTLMCPAERVAPHDITIPERDERVVVQKLPKKPVGSSGPWLLTVFGSRECFKTKTEATATGLRRCAIRDWHEERAAAAPAPEAKPETVGGEPADGEYAAVWSVPLTPGVGRVIGGQTRATFRTEPVTVLGPVNMEPSMVRVRAADGQVRRAMREHITPAAPAAVAESTPEPAVESKPVVAPTPAPVGQITVMHVGANGVRKVDVPGLTTPAAATEPEAAPATIADPATGAEVTVTRLSIGTQILEAARQLGLTAVPSTTPSGAAAFAIDGRTMTPGEWADCLLEGGYKGAYGRDRVVINPARLAEVAAAAEAPAAPEPVAEPASAEGAAPVARIAEILRTGTWSTAVVRLGKGRERKPVGMDVLTLNAGWLNYHAEYKPVAEVVRSLGGARNKEAGGFIFEGPSLVWGGGYTKSGEQKLAAWLDRNAPTTENAPAVETPVTETEHHNEEKPMADNTQSNEVDPRIAEWVTEILTMVEEDIASKIVPNGVRSFSELHDYVEANDYTESTKVPWGTGVASDGDADGMRLVNAVENEVTRQLVERIKVKGRQTDAADRPVTYTEDGRGYIVDGTGSWYVTQCCGSPVTYSIAMGDSVLCCKGCYDQADEALAELPPAAANA